MIARVCSLGSSRATPQRGVLGIHTGTGPLFASSSRCTHLVIRVGIAVAAVHHERSTIRIVFATGIQPHCQQHHTSRTPCMTSLSPVSLSDSAKTSSSALSILITEHLHSDALYNPRALPPHWLHAAVADPYAPPSTLLYQRSP